ncbi:MULTISPECIES: hypothetical protein [Methanobacterium]|uniref:Uncharacterized protein n=1 Tax=Methanobacterium bryantii TaxID=2161 RepID=A0A2A2H199_METBR|nr:MULTISPECIES: hypothetical protein [Methanobacterium]OEC86265.1 hypothetical protein A9507_11135 [Methanobacterium sp. A39]PAV03159.1 hypothetical protein ASJ80_07785 [Methanobacterium bryantii]
MKKIAPILVLILIVAVIGISGCIDSSSTGQAIDPVQDIYLDQITSPYQQDGGWSVNAWITSKAQKSYANITFIATGYTVDNEVIGTDKVFVPTLDNQYQSTGCEADFPNAKKKLDHITIQVINATPIS